PDQSAVVICERTSCIRLQSTSRRGVRHSEPPGGFVGCCFGKFETSLEPQLLSDESEIKDLVRMDVSGIVVVRRRRDDVEDTTRRILKYWSSGGTVVRCSPRQYVTHRRSRGIQKVVDEIVS